MDQSLVAATVGCIHLGLSGSLNRRLRRHRCQIFLSPKLSPSQGFSGPALGDLLEPECLLPVQYNALLRKRSTDDGEGRLLLAVLKDALRAYARNIEGRTERARRDFREACTWFNAENQEGVFAYENVCEALDLEPGLLRKWLRSLHGGATAWQRI